MDNQADNWADDLNEKKMCCFKRKKDANDKKLCLFLKKGGKMLFFFLFHEI